MPSTIRFRKKFYKIAVILGDGGGKENFTAALRVLTALGEATQTFYCEYEFFDWNNETYKEKGYFIPEGGIEKLKEFHAILCGPMGLDEDTGNLNLLDRVPDENTFQKFTKPIRDGLNHTVALQPVRPIRGAQHYGHTRPETADNRRDALLVKENNEKWNSSARFFKPEGSKSSPKDIERVVRTAFEISQLRRRKLASTINRKSRAYDSKAWTGALSTVAEDFPGVKVSFLEPGSDNDVGAIAEYLTTVTPGDLDVVVGPSSEHNVDPTLGMDAVANVDPDAQNPALFQPRRWGKGTGRDDGAGPIGSLSALAAINFMLTWLGRRDEADRLMEVVERTLVENGPHDRSASDFAEEVIVQMKNVM